MALTVSTSREPMSTPVGKGRAGAGAGASAGAGAEPEPDEADAPDDGVASPNGWRTKEDWVPDADANACFACGAAFAVLLRKHHCRLCGGVFCASCSAHTTARNLVGGFAAKAVQACDACCAKVAGGPLDPTSVRPFYSLEYAPPAKQGDRAFVHGVVARDGSGTELRHAADALKVDEALVLAAVARSAAAFQYAAPALKAQTRQGTRFMLAAAARNADVLRYIPADMRNERGFMLAVVKSNGVTLEHAADDLKEDESIVLAAVSQDGRALAFALAFQDDKTVAFAAVRQNGAAVQHLSPTLRADREIVLAAVKTEAARRDAVPERVCMAMLADAVRALPPAEAVVPDAPEYAHIALGELVVFAKTPLPPRVDTTLAYAKVVAAKRALDEQQAAVQTCEITAAVASSAQERQFRSRNEARKQFVAAADALHKEIVCPAAEKRVLKVDSSLTDLKSALNELENRLEPEPEPEPELELELVLTDALLAADAIVTDIANCAKEEVTQWEREYSCRTVHNRTDEAVLAMLELAAAATEPEPEPEPEPSHEMAMRDYLPMNARRQALDAIEGERIFREETDPLKLFPKEQLTAAMQSIVKLLEREVQHTNAICDVEDQLKTLADGCRPWLKPGARPDMKPLKATSDKMRVARDAMKLAEGVVEDAKDDAALERTSTVDQEMAVEHLEECKAAYEKAMAERIEIVAGLAEASDHFPELPKIYPELPKQLELHSSGKLPEKVTPWSSRPGNVFPSHWAKLGVEDSGGLALEDLRDHAELLQTLDACLQPEDPTQLGKGNDASGWVGVPDSNKEVQLRRAWRVHNRSLWQKYSAEITTVREQMAQVSAEWTTPIKFRAVFEEATTQLPGDRSEDVNEHYLLSGVPKETVEKILATGMNERFAGANAGTMFGAGVYFAEDGAKCDQCKHTNPPMFISRDMSERMLVITDTKSPDKGEPVGKLQELLYPAGREDHPATADAPQGVQYMFVCRVVLGCHVSTGDGETCLAKGVLTGDKMWATRERRELGSITGSDLPYHSLLGAVGKWRFREIVVFHGDRVYPEYLVAYSRNKG